MTEPLHRTVAVDARVAAVDVIGISKSYGPVVANDSVSFRIEAGSIHGVVGENGAGKSTAVRALAGFVKPDSGEIRIFGERVEFRTPRDAVAAGIGMVHQHFMLVDRFTVLENLLLAHKRGQWLPNHEGPVRQKIREYAEEYGLGVELDKPVEQLPVGVRQRVEIVKTLLGGARILLLDEPTAVLTPQEADQLFAVVRKLSGEGITTVIITHKLREIKAVTDRVTVMRRAKVVADRATAEVSEGELAELMIGRSLKTWSVPPETSKSIVGLKVKELSFRDTQGVTRLDNVSFDVAAGEIVGIAGVAGNGQSELLEALTGTLKPSSGSIEVEGRSLEGVDRPSLARSMGVAVVPEDRLRDGVIGDYSAGWNAILGYQRDPELSQGPFLSPSRIRQRAEHLMKSFEVYPPDPDLTFTSFSGGNQQKLVVAREFTRAPKVLVVGQPTRGVDVGTIELIHSYLFQERERGAAIVVVSVEIDEIMRLSDRIVVLCDGAVTGELSRAEATERKLGLLMAGSHEAFVQEETIE